MKKLICKLLGHRFKYNFGWAPNKCYCSRCGAKWKTINNPDYNGNPIETEMYIWVPSEPKKEENAL